MTCFVMSITKHVEVLQIHPRVVGSHNVMRWAMGARLDLPGIFPPPTAFGRHFSLGDRDHEHMMTTLFFAACHDFVTHVEGDRNYL